MYLTSGMVDSAQMNYTTGEINEAHVIITSIRKKLFCHSEKCQIMSIDSVSINVR